MSVFRETGARFRNAAGTRVQVFRIGNSNIGMALTACRRMFELLDRADSFQSDLAWKVWEIRAHLLFTLLPFDSPEINLEARASEIAEAAGSLPGATAAANNLASAIRSMIENPINPKYRWITQHSDERTLDGETEGTALLAMKVMGRTFGWPMNAAGQFAGRDGMSIIASYAAISDGIHDRLIVTGTCRYLPPRVLTRLFHEGRARKLDVLVYEGEYFALPGRPSPPDSTVFRGRQTMARIICSNEEVTEQPLGGEPDADQQMSDLLWNIAHDGEREAMPGLAEARYVLCTDSHGLFVPANAEVTVWRCAESGVMPHLESVRVDQLAEGDFLVMRPTDTSYLLDIASAEQGYEHVLDEACSWRPALERLLLTVGPDEVAKEMVREGAHGLALSQSIRNWADGTVYGPGARREFRALLAVLIRHGKLVPGVSFDQYLSNHWSGLHELRGIRHRAGAKVQQEIRQALERALEHDQDIRNRHSVTLVSGVKVMLHLVAAVDDRPSWIPPQRLMHMQPMKGGRWHG